MRPALRLLLVLLLVAGGLAAPAAAAAATRGGTFVAVGPVRIATARIGAGHPLVVRIAGRAGVPKSGAGAVVLAVTAASATGTGALTLYPHGATRPHTTNLSFAAHTSAVTDTAVVGLGHGLVDIATTSSVQVRVDVLGYYRSGIVTDTGAYHAVTARRVANAVVGAGRTRVVRLVGGSAGIPASPDTVGAVAATITVVRPARSGTLAGFRAGEQQNLAAVHFAAHRTVSSFAVLRVSAGKVDLENTATAAVRVHVDVLGYFRLGFAQYAGAFQTRVATRLRTIHIAPGHSATVTVGGRGGVERSGVAAVLATLHVTSASAGALQAWRAGARRPASAVAVSFPAGSAASDEVLEPVAKGKFALHNLGRHTASVTVDIEGYVRGRTAVVPASHAVARYLADLGTDLSADATLMDAHGCSDATAAPTFVLLDVGAQSITGPELDAQHPGVSLANTSATVRLTYPQLVDLLDDYLDGFLRCRVGTATPTVAIATSNDGAWNPKGANYYPPTARGRDWAAQVSAPAAVHAGSAAHVVAAGDIEPRFAGTEAQAQQWEDALRSATPGTGTALVFIGSADGCPVTWSTTGNCDFGWTKPQLHRLAGGPRIVALPQVFNGSQATQWAEIDAAASGRLRFLGELTETAVDAGTLAPAQAYLALASALRSVGGSYALSPPARPDIVAH